MGRDLDGISGGRHTPPGSSVSFVELSGNKGWIVESAKERAVLEKSVDGQFMVENITGWDWLFRVGVVFFLQVGQNYEVGLPQRVRSWRNQNSSSWGL